MPFVPRSPSSVSNGESHTPPGLRLTGLRQGHFVQHGWQPAWLRQRQPQTENPGQRTHEVSVVCVQPSRQQQQFRQPGHFMRGNFGHCGHFLQSVQQGVQQQAGRQEDR